MPSKLRQALFVTVIAMAVFSACRTASAAGYDRPAGDRQQSRSVVLATGGMVATSHPLAAQVGVDVLKAGGSAADAAIAANAMLTVVEPMSCGVGGDLFAIYWDAKTKKLYGLNASGRSPQAISREFFAERRITHIPFAGPLSWSVPGCVDGWEELRGRFGRKKLSELLAPSIEAAENGFPVTEVIAAAWQSSARALAKHPDSAATYLVNGRAPRHGEVFRNPRYATTLRQIAQGGRDAFYRGPIAEQIVKFSRANGGLFDKRDFSEHESTWVEPVSTTYRGYRVWELPPNGQGIAVLQMLNILEGYDIKSLGPGSVEYLHLLLEAKKLAFADRARFYADPAFGEMPTAELISKQYGQQRRELIDPDQAAGDVLAGDPKLAEGDTVYLTVVDKDRNCCSLIQSTYAGFGSKVVPGQLGFALQNRGTLFSLEEDHPNRLEPGKRPFHTIIPAMVTNDSEAGAAEEQRPVLCFGVMGGDMQPQGHVQVLVNMIDFGMNIQAAGDAARVRHRGSATPTGVAAAGVGTVSVESAISERTVTALREKGHNVVRGRHGFGGYQAIQIDWKNNVLHGATEPRKDGAAVGY